MEEIKEQIEIDTEEQLEETDSRSNLNIQQYMNDMRLLGEQIGSRDLVKPPFNYGQLEVTNYLLWLLLGEIMSLNDKLKEGTE